MKINTVLTIAGSDCSGGAGIQADIKTMTANGVYGMSIITALTAQNTLGVKSVLDSTPEFLQEQFDAVFEDIFPDAVKIGMIPSKELIHITAENLAFYNPKNIVLDPVMVSTSGSSLIKSGAVQTLEEELFPLATLITPNIPEAQILTQSQIKDKAGMIHAAKLIGEKYSCAVLLKGGHRTSDADDLLYINGEELWLNAQKINNPNTHGTGCTLSSAIASFLAKGFDIPLSVQKGKAYVSHSLSANLDLGRGAGPLMHNFKLQIT